MDDLSSLTASPTASDDKGGDVMQDKATEEEMEDEEYDLMLSNSGHYEEGRNMTTGY